MSNDYEKSFRRAIVWSAPDVVGKSKQVALRQYRRVARDLSCEGPDDWQCLQSKSPQEIINATYGNLVKSIVPSVIRGLYSQIAEPFGPIVDGEGSPLKFKVFELKLVKNLLPLKYLVHPSITS